MLDEIAVLIFFLCAIISMIVLIYTLNQGKTARRSLWNEMMQQWAQNQIKQENHNLAIQALRNLLIANSGLISALLVTLSIFIGVFPSVFSNQSIFTSFADNVTVGMIQFSTITLCIVISAFFFILSSRTASSLSFLISSITNLSNDNSNVENIIVNTFRSTQLTWLIAIRGLFYLIAALTWVVNTFLFIIITIAITSYLILFRDL